MRKLASALLAATVCLAPPALAQHDPLAPLAAAELDRMCASDAARLWGVSLCAPLLVVNPQSRVAWASVADNAGVLTPTGGAGFVGVLPIGAPIANTRVEWGGRIWVMVVAPLPENETERRVLLAHEAWHRVQESLGFAMASPANAHLETERGRTLLRLELRALATALRSRGNARQNAARDALTLRAARFAAFRDAARDELALDRNEGLASYTGVRLGAGNGADQFAMRTLDNFDHHDALARSFPYATGPAYGLLLDERRPAWRTELGGGAPADMLFALLRPGAPTPHRLAEITARYGPNIAAEERARAEAQAARIAVLRARYAEGPRLILPLAQMQMEFNPNAVTPIEGLGTVYVALVLRDRWGELRAQDGAVIASDFTLATAAQPAADGLSGPGWTLSLAPGWAISPPAPDGARRVHPLPQAQ